MCRIRPANSDGSVHHEGATLPEPSTLPDPEVMPVMKPEIARHFLGLGRSAMYGFDRSGRASPDSSCSDSVWPRVDTALTPSPR
jgi:hypothetical protein